jgi:hypothetical protein
MSSREGQVDDRIFILALTRSFSGGFSECELVCFGDGAIGTMSCLSGYQRTENAGWRARFRSLYTSGPAVRWYEDSGRLINLWMSDAPGQERSRIMFLDDARFGVSSDGAI